MNSVDEMNLETTSADDQLPEQPIQTDTEDAAKILEKLPSMLDWIKQTGDEQRLLHTTTYVKNAIKQCLRIDVDQNLLQSIYFIEYDEEAYDNKEEQEALEDFFKQIANAYIQFFDCDQEIEQKIQSLARELIKNAFRDGNQYDPNKAVHVVFGGQYMFGKPMFVLYIGDQGEGFRLEDVPNPLDEDVIEARKKAGKAEGGYGLLMTNGFLDRKDLNGCAIYLPIDEVDDNSREVCVLLTKPKEN